MRYRDVVGVVVLLSLAGCREKSAPGPEYTTVGQFDTATVAIITARDTIPVRVELAENENQRALGLMERRQLDDSHGMLFVYPEVQDSTGSFWMFRTRIPLDIAFTDSTGTIVSIRSMEPCASPYPQGCPSYAAGKPFQRALEVNKGWFEKRGVAVGDRIIVRGESQ